VRTVFTLGAFVGSCVKEESNNCLVLANILVLYREFHGVALELYSRRARVFQNSAKGFWNTVRGRLSGLRAIVRLQPDWIFPNFMLDRVVADPSPL